MQKTASPAAGCLPACCARVAPSPAVTAILGDTLWCLGLGCLLGFGRGLYTLLLGEGALRCFVGDILAFAAAAVLLCGFAAGASASGLSRWYMAAAMAAGALCWQLSVQTALQCALGALLAALVWPYRQLHKRVLHPIAQRFRTAVVAKKQKKTKNVQKKHGKRQKSSCQTRQKCYIIDFI